MKRKLVIMMVVSLGLLLLIAGYAKSAEKSTVASFPSEMIKFMIAGMTGDAFDTVGRKISPTLAEKFGVKVLPVNIKGPKSVDFWESLLAAKPDGYTFGIISSTDRTQRVLDPRLLKTTFDVTKIPVVLAINTFPDAVFAPKPSRFKTARDFLNDKKPVRIADYASLTTGLGVLAIIGKERNWDFRPVIYNTYGQAAVGAIRGDVDLITATPSGTNMKFVRSGDYIPLFVWGKKRFNPLPDTPCSAELGLPSIFEEVMLRRIFVVPPGTPSNRIAKLAEGITATLTDPKMIEWSKQAEQPLEIMSGEEFLRIANQIDSYYKQNIKTLEPFLK